MIDYSEKTRLEYHSQHMQIVDDKKAMKRVIGMFSEEYFDLGNNFFKNKTVLDAGCGDTAGLIIALHKFGSKQIYGFDIGNEFIPFAKKSLKNFNVPEKDVILIAGNVLEIPYEDEFFDFVSAHGVLGHLNNLEEVSLAFKELTRVTKPNGYFYSVFQNVEGLFEDALVPALRKYYKTNSDFRELIDTLTKNDFKKILKFITNSMKSNTGEKIDLGFVAKLLDTDLCVTIQNKIKTPRRLKIDEKLILKHYRQNNFIEVRRLKRYVKRENIRKFTAPLHYERENPISKIFYGSGGLEFIGKRKSV